MRAVVLPIAILAYACALRIHFFSGFVLCDDYQELSAVTHILEHAPTLSDQFHLRFGVWLFNVLAFRLFGFSEATFFLPTVLMSGSLPVVAYALLLCWRYPLPQAVAAAVMVASAPFEVLLGTLRANDVILAWLVGLGLLGIVALTRRPLLQGFLAAALFWLALYVKIWVVYLLPALAVHYLLGWNAGRRRAALAFVATSLVLHGATCLLWKSRTGAFLPFLWNHAATYPIRREDLPELFRTYPRQLFFGSEFGTTLFGAIPYLLLLGLGLKLVGTALGKRWAFDARDGALLALYGSFLVLLELCPNALAVDRYYSAPRIFRYLAPASFPMTVHVAKIALDLTPSRWPALAALLLLTIVDLAQARAAAAPTIVHREKLVAAVEDIRERRPPAVVAEYWLAYFLTNVYLRDLRAEIEVIYPINVYPAAQHEAWLAANQHRFAPGTLLLTGLASCVHYGAHFDGFRLGRFQHPLDPAWTLVKSYGPLTYLPQVEQVELWELTHAISAQPAVPDAAVDGRTPEELFRDGMVRFDAGDCLSARPSFEAVKRRFASSSVAADAWYFDTICAYRSGQWRETIAGFTELVRRFPDSVWIPAAQYHAGVAYAAVGDRMRAREAFEYVRGRFPDDYNAKLAAERLAEVGADVETGVLVKLWRRARARLAW